MASFTVTSGQALNATRARRTDLERDFKRVSALASTMRKPFATKGIDDLVGDTEWHLNRVAKQLHARIARLDRLDASVSHAVYAEADRFWAAGRGAA